MERFDWRKGCKFFTYATWWIRRAIARGAADRGARAIRLPVHAVLGISRERARQLERATLAVLRRPEIRARLEDLAS